METFIYIFSFLFLPTNRFSQLSSPACIDASVFRELKDARGLPRLIYTHKVLFASQHISARTQVDFLGNSPKTMFNDK